MPAGFSRDLPATGIPEKQRKDVEKMVGYLGFWEIPPEIL